MLLKLEKHDENESICVTERSADERRPARQASRLGRDHNVRRGVVVAEEGFPHSVGRGGGASVIFLGLRRGCSSYPL